MNWMHSCKRVAELLSQRFDEPLSLIDELRLSLHLSMCGDCSNMAGQLEAVQLASAQLFSKGLELDEIDPSAPPRCKGAARRV